MDFLFFSFLGVGPPTTLHSTWDLSSGQGSIPSPLQWKHGVLTAGLPGKYLGDGLFKGAVGDVQG